MFLGIGDVAPYVRHSLEQLVTELGGTSHVMVVAPNIEAQWSESNWANVMPDLPSGQRWEMDAADFAQGLLAVWVNDALRQIRDVGDAVGLSLLPAAFARWKAVIRLHDADRVLAWMRRSHHRRGRSQRGSR